MKNHDTILKISIPKKEEIKLPESSGNSPEILRSRAAQCLKDIFGSDCWTLREGGSRTDKTELKVAVKTTRLAEFRAKIAELGFEELNGANLSDEDAGRQS